MPHVEVSAKPPSRPTTVPVRFGPGPSWANIGVWFFLFLAPLVFFTLLALALVPLSMSPGFAALIALIATALLCGLPLSISLKRHRIERLAALARSKHCRRCGYDLKGLPIAVPCPECGTSRGVGGEQ